MTRLRATVRWYVSQGPIIVAFTLLATATLFGIVFQVLDETNERTHTRDQDEQVERLRAQVDQLQDELTCRSEIGAEASNIQGEIGRATALGLVAVARNDQGALAAQADQIEALAVELGPALELRAEAVERCEDPPGD